MFSTFETTRRLGPRSKTLPIAAFAAGLLGGAAALGQGSPQPFNTEKTPGGPMAAAEVVAKTPLPEGFRMSVFAQEPDLFQPISMATDPRGRLWVAENFTYSEAAVGYHKELLDRVVVFTDRDNDGRFDGRSVFWDQARRLTSVEVGLGGVWALALPELVFIPDRDGDGVADGPPEVVLDGFEYQAGRHTVANGLRWGPDGWLYGRHGIQSTSWIGAPGVEQSRRVGMNVGIWRYHPIRKVVEVVAQGTTNPWGMDWDAKGEMFFINTVIGHLWHVIPGAHYQRMYGDDPTPRIYAPLDQTADHVHWATGEVWTDVRKGVTDLTSAAGGGHAHTGLLIYQGGQWPAAWAGKLLAINYHGRRLNVDRLERDRGGFVARHEPDQFLFADEWFRGIDLLAAPDGGVFVSDWSDAGECHDQEGIHRTSGRVYKITHGPAAAPPADLTLLGSVDLVRMQTSRNDWQARQARRVLADRAARGEALDLGRAELLRLAGHADEVTRLRATWALHVSGGVPTPLLRRGLAGTESERAWALRLMEDAAHASSGEADAFARFVAEELPALARAEAYPMARLTLASLLQKLPPAQRFPVAAALLGRAEDAGDRRQSLMLWYGIEPLAGDGARFVELIAGASLPTTQRLGARRLAEDYGARPELVDGLLRAVARSPLASSRAAALDGLADGFAGQRRVAKPAAWDEAVGALAAGADEPTRRRIQDLGALFGDGRAVAEIAAAALDPGADLARRRAALESLIEARAPNVREVAERLLPIRELSATAAKGMALYDDPALARRMIAEWRALYGSERPGVLNALLSRPAWAGLVLEAIAEGRMARGDLGVPQARQIAGFGDKKLTARLGEVWGVLREPDEASRQAGMAAWRGKLEPAKLERANLGAGRELYAAACGQCHKLYGAGGEIGPDLTGSGRRDLGYLLENILFPSAVVPAGYRQTTLALKDGRTLSGIVASRGARALQLRMIGEVATVALEEIEREETSELSLMPEGLLDALTEAQAADLIAYLMSGSPPPAE